MGQTELEETDQFPDVESQTVTLTPDVIFTSKEYEKKHKCTYEGCDAIFLRPSRLARHIRIHTGEKPYKCKHKDCDKAYTNSSHLKRHMETHDLTKKTYQCTICHLMISSRHNLKRHYKCIHDSNKLSCKECNATFTKKYQLVEHTAIHAATTLLKCEKCNKSFVRMSRFIKHQQVHEKKYPCTAPECTEVFDKWPLLRKHLKRSHVTEYKCDQCGKIFLSKSHLRIHNVIHSENRPVIVCPYEKCHRSYYFQRNLDHHIRLNHLGKKFHCDVCSVGLSSKQKLIEHIARIHEFKKKTVRKPQTKKRKDTGISKKSMVSKLIGVNLPASLEKMILHRETEIKLKENKETFNSNDKEIDFCIA